MTWLIAILLLASAQLSWASEDAVDRQPTRTSPDSAAETAGDIRARQLPPEPVLRRYLYNREDEDWRWLAGGASMPDRLDRLKYIPFGKDGALGFGGEVRTRTEWIKNRSWGFGPSGPGSGPEEDTHLLSRARVHADLRLGERFRVFGQLQAAWSSNRDGGPRTSIDQDLLGLQQLFAEFALPGGSALRAGRAAPRPRQRRGLAARTEPVYQPRAAPGTGDGGRLLRRCRCIACLGRA